MITLNGNKFAKTEKEFTDSLFQKGGTCVGYYRVYKRQVVLLDHNKIKVGTVVNNVIAKAQKLDNGKWWYSHGTVDLVGEYDSYNKEYDEIHAVMSLLN